MFYVAICYKLFTWRLKNMLNKSDILKSFAQKAKRRLVGKETPVSAKIKVISNEDEDFKSKVEFLLSQEDLVTNPVQYLIDEKEFSKLDEAQKERYLLSTLDKYNSLRRQIENLSDDHRFCI